MSHVPAPWVYCQKWQKVTTADGGQLVADIRGWGWLQKLPDGEAIQDANGYLIAAAPDLLAALIEALPYVEATLSNHDAGCQRHPSTEHARDCILSDLDQIKAAIAKATGEKS